MVARAKKGARKMELEALRQSAAKFFGQHSQRAPSEQTLELGHETPRKTLPPRSPSSADAAGGAPANLGSLDGGGVPETQSGAASSALGSFGNVAVELDSQDVGLDSLEAFSIRTPEVHARRKVD